MINNTERRVVPQNEKCEGCLHYDGNAATMGGACEVGGQPYMCGDGKSMTIAGYAPLADMPVEGGADTVIPMFVGQAGAMNETGSIEPTIKMQTVCLGDELVPIALRILGEHKALAKSYCGMHQSFGDQGYVPIDQGSQRCSCHATDMRAVAKSLHALYLRPREQHAFGINDVLEFLAAHGMPVTKEDLSTEE